ncbi:MAG: hypothetical protein JW955_03035 [Sedimentisphaerales bacterium]|nr:hypothetical protein [Sedimentisphaerales bacterium]
MEQRTIIRSGSEKEICRLRGGLVMAVDLGFSKSRKSCGLAWKDSRSAQPKADNYTFGKCIDEVFMLLESHRRDTAAMIVEAPLSGRFDKEGNPVERGNFERGASDLPHKATRYWYSGPGAAMCLAAAFFLRDVVRRLCESPVEALPREVVLYGGFVTFKSKTTNHSRDAQRLLDSFFCTPCPVPPVQAPTDHFVLPILDVIGSAGATSVAPVIIAPDNDGV